MNQQNPFLPAGLNSREPVSSMDDWKSGFLFACANPVVLDNTRPSSEERDGCTAFWGDVFYKRVISESALGAAMWE